MEGMEKGGGGEEPPPVRPHDHLSIVEESRPPVHWEPILNNSQSIGFQDLLGKNPTTIDFGPPQRSVYLKDTYQVTGQIL